MKVFHHFAITVVLLAFTFSSAAGQEAPFSDNLSVFDFGVGVEFYDSTPYLSIPAGYTFKNGPFLYSAKAALLFTQGDPEDGFVKDSSISSGCREVATGRFAESSKCRPEEFGVSVIASAGYILANENSTMWSLGPMIGVSNNGYFYGGELKAFFDNDFAPVVVNLMAGHSPNTEGLVGGLTVALTLPGISTY